MAMSWRFMLGAVTHPGRVVTFRVWAPAAAQVAVRVEGAGTPRALEPGGGGFFQATLAGVPLHTRYAYLLDGAVERPDPCSRLQTRGPEGTSQVLDDEATRRPTPTVLASPPAARDLRPVRSAGGGPWTFAGAGAEAVGLAAAGAGAVELGPVTERGPGGLPAALLAPDWAAGGPRGLADAVRRCRGAGLRVVLRLPFARLGTEARWLLDFGPWLAAGRGGLRLDLARPQVRSLAVELALATLLEHGADAVSLLAPAGGWDGLAEFEAELADRSARLGLPASPLVLRHEVPGPRGAAAPPGLADHDGGGPSAQAGGPYDAPWHA